ncbi:Hypothetical Protein RradSPS_1732 [Rubrobacter radiotolerans]|uniref:Gram-positive cocci surface proteins LPxTG domain-containing protein n=1 Tax=Rubrobacter radiotolerans TaxID=42256 RepID=A0A023X4U4_RUBRA|nr:hypothetical protein [Rubrobacter radiotolerans]AHY47015.1 Hypothetical Protein RradSPS_1732 [Rubrobacter radiotolerans]MDX5894421.1 hypothetical protein [Rubrobacter radiotolerans]SMC05969.1 hypothetical protein SAMN00767673_1734 [Rubrobacter radiotolerans DSM 5868]
MGGRVLLSWRRLMVVLITGLALSLFWAAAAQAQEIPFDSQYGAPPISPPAAEAPAATGGDSGGAVLSETEAPVVDLLPTTGGVPLAALLLGGSALLVGGATIALRRRS